MKQQFTQEEAIQAYHNGSVLFNSSRGEKDVVVFKLFDRMFVTNVKRNTKYSFDDCCWEVKSQGISALMYKWTQFMWKRKVLNDCKKSLKAGV